MKRLRLFAFYWLPVLVWCAVIFYFSCIPHLRFTESWWDFAVRKIGHFGVFAILARLFARAFTASTLWSWRRIFFCSLLATFFYACTDEYHQTYTPGRVGCVQDVLIDTAGAWAALGVIP